MELSKLSKSKRKWNVENAPIIPTIPLSRVVIDPLHLFLQVSDVLLDCLIDDLMRRDALSKTIKIASGKVNRDKYAALTRFEDFVQSQGIPFSFYVDKGQV